MHFLDRHWQRLTPVSIALYPLSLVFRFAVLLRRGAYSAGLFSSRRVRVPVIVVGNITVGGTGKTPLVLWLARFLAECGMKPAIVSRGYGANLDVPRAVTPASDPANCGDEPVLLAQRCLCPVWVGRDRAAVCEALLKAHPGCDVLLSDDGLQHYSLARDLEIAVVDGIRGNGNGFMLPAGPLREPVSRLRSVDAVVVNGEQANVQGPNVFGMKLEGREFHNLLNPDHIVGPAYFRSRRVRAVAGIGNPDRFFSHLQALGLRFDAQPFADHHRYTPSDLAGTDFDDIVMTEKDAVKCAPFAAETHWALRVAAVPDAGLRELVLRKLKR
jgi:tetraacyldisaccharide 4'-kinase